MRYWNNYVILWQMGCHVHFYSVHGFLLSCMSDHSWRSDYFDEDFNNQVTKMLRLTSGPILLQGLSPGVISHVD